MKNMQNTRRNTEVGEVLHDTWSGCYGEGWKGVISDAAFAHP